MNKAILFLQPRPVFDVAWMYSELDATVLSLAIAVKTGLCSKWALIPGLWEPERNCSEWENKELSLFSVHRSLGVQTGFMGWETEPRGQAGEEGLAKGQWPRVRTFGFGAHCFSCEVEVPTLQLLRRRQGKVKWHRTGICWVTKEHQPDYLENKINLFTFHPCLSSLMLFLITVYT